ncbi:MAG: DUF6427 family protein [Bacteroidales bacterium]|nr:DUF6427 family protein [Bacteroidales bacterium]
MDFAVQSLIFSLPESFGIEQEWVFPLTGFMILIASALLLNASLVRHELIPKNSMLGAFIYVLLMSQSPAAIGLNPVLFASLFLIPAFDRILNTFGQADPTKDVFSASFLLAMASLFYLPSIVFLLILLFSFVVFGTFSIRIILVAFSGLVAVYLYVGLFYFLTNQVEDKLADYMNYFIHLPAIELPHTFHQYIIWGMHLVIFVVSVLYIFTHINEWVISVRRKSMLILWFTLLAVASIALQGNAVMVVITIAAIPLCAMVSEYFAARKKPSFMLELYVLVMVLYTFINNTFMGPC